MLQNFLHSFTKDTLQNSLRRLTIFDDMLVTDFIDKMLYVTQYTYQLSVRVLNVRLITNYFLFLFSISTFRLQKHILLFHENITNCNKICVQCLTFVHTSKIKAAVETNAQTKISEGCVTRNNLNFYLLFKSCQILSPANSC